MVKVIDLDQLFNKYIEDFVYSNIGKLKPEDIENKIPEFYVKFGDEKLKELDGATPNEYYKQFSATELIECLKAHLEQGVSVSDFLCEGIVDCKEGIDALADALKQTEDEEFILYAMNMLGVEGGKQCADRYLEFIDWDYSQSVRELATEMLAEFASLVKEKVIAKYYESPEDKKVYYTEILSNTCGDDRVFEILTTELIAHQDNIPLYAGYVSKFGDDRAIPLLTEIIEREDITYADFEELRFAIEALGGSYDKKRNFTADKTYKKIKGEKIKNLKV